MLMLRWIYSDDIQAKFGTRGGSQIALREGRRQLRRGGVFITCDSPGTKGGYGHRL